MYWNKTYADAKKVLTAWNNMANDNSDVGDVALNLINRAVSTLWDYHPWDYQTKKLSLTPAGRIASFPSDFGKVIDIYSEPAGNGRPFTFFYRNGDSNTGYEMRATYSKSALTTWEVEFYAAPVTTIILNYQFDLEDFTGAGTEYLPFPVELVILQAKIIGMSDNGIPNTGEYNIVDKELSQKLRDFQQAHQYSNPDPLAQLKDANGYPVHTQAYTMNGSFSNQHFGFENSRDLG